MPGLEILSGTVANSSTALSRFSGSFATLFIESGTIAGGKLQSLASGQISPASGVTYSAVSRLGPAPPARLQPVRCTIRQERKSPLGLGRVKTLCHQGPELGEAAMRAAYLQRADARLSRDVAHGVRVPVEP